MTMMMKASSFWLLIVVQVTSSHNYGIKMHQTPNLRVESIRVAVQNDVDSSTTGRRNDGVLEAEIDTDDAAHDDCWF